MGMKSPLLFHLVGHFERHFLPIDAVMQHEITVICAFKGREVIGCF